MNSFYDKCSLYLPRTGISIWAWFVLGVSGCSDYSITVNDNLLYTPPSIFTDFKLPDRSLQQCIDDTINDEYLTSAEQLSRLYCTKRNISSLDQMEIFPNLKQVGLADNNLTDISPLAQLHHLEQINLKGNNIKDATPLKKISTLQFVDLSDNPNLNCGSVPADQRIKIILPEHC